MRAARTALKTAVALGTAAALVGVTACGSSSAGSTSSSSSSGAAGSSSAASTEPVTLHVWMQGDTLKDIDIEALNKEFEAAHQGVTAVYCYNDRMAMGLYDGLREHGLAIPEDMAVVGFDNQEVIAAHLRPPLSTVSLPHYELGAAGVRMLLGLDQAAGDGPVKIACPAVERASVAVHTAA